MQSKYPALSWSLNLNTELKSKLFETYKSKHNDLLGLNSLINELKNLSCDNIQKTIEDVDNLYKFDSIISELEIGKYLAGNGMNVEFLSDDYFGKNPSPDILCKNEYFNSYVEVTKLSENEAIVRIIDSLRVLLKNLPYRVDAKLKSVLSLPKLRGKERKIQDDLVEISLKQFENNIKNDFSDFPIEIETDGIIFEVHKVNSSKGYPGFIEPEVIKVPTEDLMEYVKERIIKKAKKRDKSFWEHRNLYIIAFDCEETFIDELDIDMLLYGQTHELALNILNLPEEVYEEWKQNEWNSIVSKVQNDPVWKK
ncbi:MAG: hypothetical protein KAR07_01830 [Spirochaetes bacterium]|nr:hypothetical protein [Spirochaetota bacterium]